MGNLGVSVQCPVAPKTRVNECMCAKLLYYAFLTCPLKLFVAHYVITDQSDCSIGVQYIESYSTFL